MTEQKHLKKLVRARMARTGETYTTARRHVLGPARVQHRESALVARMLHGAGYVAPHTGQPYTEAMVCGLAGGIGFMYALFEYANVPPMLTIVAQHHPEPWLPAAMTNLGIPYTEEHSSRTDPALTALRVRLDRGQAVMCAVDKTQLPWRAGQFGLAQDPHHCLVTERDGSTLTVDDGADARYTIDEAQFGRAWAGYRKGRYERTVIAPGAEVDLPVALRSAIRTTVSHLTGPVLGNSFDVNFGFSGMARLGAALRDQRRAGWLQRFADPGAFATVVARLHDCLEVQYTAPGATRPLYADFLDEAASVLGDKRIGPAAAAFRESGQIWSRLAGQAAEVGDDLGELAELATRRLHVVITQGQAGRDEIRALSAEIAASGQTLPSEDERRSLLHELADLVDQARETEEHAAEFLSVGLEP
jgi:Domain of unknown function (DUF4872)/Butirosin biosynthesis protein H, N-terminal